MHETWLCYRETSSAGRTAYTASESSDHPTAMTKITAKVKLQEVFVNTAQNLGYISSTPSAQKHSILLADSLSTRILATLRCPKKSTYLYVVIVFQSIKL